jgi:hypothetical protein
VEEGERSSEDILHSRLIGRLSRAQAGGIKGVDGID